MNLADEQRNFHGNLKEDSVTIVKGDVIMSREEFVTKNLFRQVVFLVCHI